MSVKRFFSSNGLIRRSSKKSFNFLVKNFGKFFSKFQDDIASLKVHVIFDIELYIFLEKYFLPMLQAFFMDLLKEFRIFSEMKFKIFPVNFSKFPGGKIQFSPRNFTDTK